MTARSTEFSGGDVAGRWAGCVASRDGRWRRRPRWTADGRERSAIETKR